MREISIFGLRLRQQSLSGPLLQEILTKHGCTIKTRLGLNDTEGSEGIIILELTGNEAEKESLRKELLKISGLTLREMNL